MNELLTNKPPMNKPPMNKPLLNKPWRLCIAADHPAYAGHFPGQPILPGVVLLDAAFHALAEQSGNTLQTGQIKSAKFHSPALPGDALYLQVSPGKNGELHFEISCMDDAARKVASGVLLFTAAGAA